MPGATLRSQLPRVVVRTPRVPTWSARIFPVCVRAPLGVVSRGVGKGVGWCRRGVGPPYLSAATQNRRRNGGPVKNTHGGDRVRARAASRPVARPSSRSWSRSCCSAPSSVARSPPCARRSSAASRRRSGQGQCLATRRRRGHPPNTVRIVPQLRCRGRQIAPTTARYRRRRRLRDGQVERIGVNIGVLLEQVGRAGSLGRRLWHRRIPAARRDLRPEPNWRRRAKTMQVVKDGS